jgi:hypothetical protein
MSQSVEDVVWVRGFRVVERFGCTHLLDDALVRFHVDTDGSLHSLLCSQLTVLRQQVLPICEAVDVFVSADHAAGTVHSCVFEPMGWDTPHAAEFADLASVVELSAPTVWDAPATQDLRRLLGRLSEAGIPGLVAGTPLESLWLAACALFEPARDALRAQALAAAAVWSTADLFVAVDDHDTGWCGVQGWVPSNRLIRAPGSQFSLSVPWIRDRVSACGVTSVADIAAVMFEQVAVATAAGMTVRLSLDELVAAIDEVVSAPLVLLLVDRPHADDLALLWPSASSEWTTVLCAPEGVTCLLPAGSWWCADVQDVCLSDRQMQLAAQLADECADVSSAGWSDVVRTVLALS